jgi:hypothetical protein
MEDDAMLSKGIGGLVLSLRLRACKVSQLDIVYLTDSGLSQHKCQLKFSLVIL